MLMDGKLGTYNIIPSFESESYESKVWPLKRNLIASYSFQVVNNGFDGSKSSNDESLLSTNRMLRITLRDGNWCDFCLNFIVPHSSCWKHVRHERRYPFGDCWIAITDETRVWTRLVSGNVTKLLAILKRFAKLVSIIRPNGHRMLNEAMILTVNIVYVLLIIGNSNIKTNINYTNVSALVITPSVELERVAMAANCLRWNWFFSLFVIWLFYLLTKFFPFTLIACFSNQWCVEFVREAD